MKSFENSEVVNMEQAIARHEITPKNRNENQIRLATDLYEFLLGSKINLEDRNQRNDAMEYWTETGYSKAYRELEQEEIFKAHPRLQGDIFRITVEDMLYYLRDKTLPE